MGSPKNYIATKLFGAGNEQRITDLLRLTGITGAAQVLIQAIGLVSGIAVIRLLSTEEYAFYTLANTMLGVVMILADSGIGAGVMAESGKVWDKPKELGQVLNTGLDLRKKFAVGSLLVSGPVLIFLLHHHGAGWLMAVLIVASLIPALVGSLTGSIFMVPLKLQQDIKPLQRNLIFENVGRLGIIMSLFVLPWTFIAILASGIPRMVLNVRLHKMSNDYVDWKQKPSAEIRARIMKIVKRLMPGSIYYCVSGQVTIWLISVFGSTTSLAQLGALGRISMLVTMINTIFGIILYPRFSRLKNDSKLLLKRFLQIILLLSLVCSLVVVGVHLFSEQVLWVLGDQYSGLHYALVLSIIGSCMRVVSGAVFRLSTNRSWVINPVLSIPVSICSIILAAWLMNLTTLEGILIFNIVIVAVQLILNSGYFFFKIYFNKEEKAPAEESL